jgi:hypothetical protein
MYGSNDYNLTDTRGEPPHDENNYCENCGDKTDCKCACGHFICEDCRLVCDACEETLGCKFCFQTLVDGNFCNDCIDAE